MARVGLVRVNGVDAARLIELERGKSYRLEYIPSYAGPPISLALPVNERIFEFDGFIPFFDGTLPEGYQLDALLRRTKLDRKDHMGQLLEVGRDLVGNVTVEPLNDEGTGDTDV